MEELLELAARLDFAATCSDMGRAPDHSSVTRRSAKALRAAKREILSLRAELTEQARINGMGAERELKLIAERDEARGEVAAIVAWLRDGAMFAQAMADQVRNAASSNTLRSQADAFSTAAAAIEARAYVKENDGDG